MKYERIKGGLRKLGSLTPYLIAGAGIASGAKGLYDVAVLGEATGLYYVLAGPLIMGFSGLVAVALDKYQ